ncbi:LexA family protein [Phytopseudomonas seleniipraecipitans]|uniref:DNA polymerase V n=1 Tax=Phytopseudomonas seleniipraecipitans TaxID=640205 RepID=A0A1G7JAG0_9GAMM|nr:translesion error-prone DNA polymerase V autoproteolytic subunit [Pseudomonas seleniipraecipitans]SDF21891.1 DNA polymerase V [Pseudomonas seleniipraecipitans]
MGNATILGPVGSSDIELPFFSFRVPAGFPSPAQDHLEQKISLDELLDIHAPQTYLVRVDGDSMIGAGIFDGDVLVVNKALDAVPGDIVIAAINGEPVVKTLARDGQQIVLRSENPKYAPRFVMEGDELLIWAVVTDSIRRHRCHG